MRRSWLAGIASQPAPDRVVLCPQRVVIEDHLDAACFVAPGPRGRSSHPRSHVKGPRLWPVQRLAQLRALLGQRDDDLAAVAVSGSPRDAMVAGQRGAGGAVAEPPQPRRPAQSGSAFGCLWACRAAAAWRAVAGQRTDTPFALLRNQRLLRVNIGRAAGGSREQRADAWDDRDAWCPGLPACGRTPVWLSASGPRRSCTRTR